MLTLIKHLKNLKIKNILYVHETGELNIDFLSLLSSISPEIWILVITNDTSIDRYKYRSKFDVVYSSYMLYKPILKFDVVFVPNNHFEYYLQNKKLSKTVITIVPFTGYEEYTTVYETTKEFYMPHKFLSWAPLSVQRYLSKYKLFADKSVKFLMGSFDENRR